MFLQDRSYKISFLCAVMLHVALGVFFSIKLVETHNQPGMQQHVDIVQAFSISQSEIASNLTQATPIKQQPQPSPATTTPTSQEETKPAPQEDKDNALKQQKIVETLKQRIQKEQAKELELLKKEAQIKQREITTDKKSQEKQEQKKKDKLEKLALQDVLHQELAAEGKKLQQKQHELRNAAASTAKTAENATSTSNPAPAGSSAAATEIDKYKALLIQAISQEWIIPDSVDKNESCKLLIKLAPGGVVLSVQVITASSNAALDHSAQTAIWKASPLPVPQDKELFDNFRTIQLTVHPQEIVSEQLL